MVTGGWKTSLKFKKEVLEELKETLRSTAREELFKIVSEIVEEQKVHDTIKSKLDSTVIWIEEHLAHERIESRIEKLVNQRLKDKLGLA